MKEGRNRDIKKSHLRFSFITEGRPVFSCLLLISYEQCNFPRIAKIHKVKNVKFKISQDSFKLYLKNLKNQ